MEKLNYRDWERHSVKSSKILVWILANKFVANTTEEFNNKLISLLHQWKTCLPVSKQGLCLIRMDFSVRKKSLIQLKPLFVYGQTSFLLNRFLVNAIRRLSWNESLGRASTFLVASIKREKKMVDLTNVLFWYGQPNFFIDQINFS